MLSEVAFEELRKTGKRLYQMTEQPLFLVVRRLNHFHCISYFFMNFAKYTLPSAEYPFSIYIPAGRSLISKDF